MSLFFLRRTILSAIGKMTVVASNIAVFSNGTVDFISRKVPRLACFVLKIYKLLTTQRLVLLTLFFTLHRSLMKRRLFKSYFELWV
jgi:hypothetical protein